MKTNEILKSLRQKEGITQAEAAEKLGVSLSSYQKYERDKGSVMPSLDVLVKIADMYRVTTDYLLGREKPSIYYHEGLEERLKDTYKKLPREVRANILQAMYDAVVGYQKEQEPEPVAQPITMTFYADAASAGTGEPLSDNPTEEIEIAETPEADNANCVIRINGDSMQPTFADGDLVLVKYQQTVELGEVGVFIVNGEGYIKELGKNCLISHNDKYDDIPLHDTDTVRCTGLVVGTAQEYGHKKREPLRTLARRSQGHI